MDPSTVWVATSPGVMELPTTKFRITYRVETGSYTLTWGGGGERVHVNLRSAQEDAVRWMADLIEMGMEV